MSLLVESYGWVLVCFSALLSAALCLVGKPVKRRYKLPPGPFNFPILGMLPHIDRTNPGLSLWKLSKKYGETFYGYMGSYGAVVLNSQTTIKKYFSQGDDVFSDRPPLAVFEVFSDRKGVVSCELDSHWKEQRRFLLRALKNFGMGRSQGRFCDVITCETAHVLKFFGKTEAPFDPEEIIFKAVTNVISSFVFGRRFDYEDEEYKQFILALKKIFHLASTDGTTNYLRFMRHVPLSPYRDLVACTRRLHDGLFRKEIEEHERNFSPDQDPNDLIDCFLLEISKQSAESPGGNPDPALTGFTRAHLQYTIGDTFAAGSDTTATILAWVTILAVKFQDEQRKLQEEIDRVVGRDRLPTLKDRPKMPLMEAFVTESLRYISPGPLGVPRSTWKDTTIDGYDIPKGTVLIANLYAVLHDPDVFPDPDTFKPSRFIDECGQLRSALVDKANAQFGIGRRACPGMDLARMERFLFASSLLHQFHLTPPDGPDSISLDWIVGLSVIPAPYKLVATRRR